MPDLGLLITRFDAMGVEPSTDHERRLAMLTVCEAMAGSSCEDIQEVLVTLGLVSAASPRALRKARSHSRSR